MSFLKKNIIIILAGLVGAAFILFFAARPSVPIAALLPGDTFFYARLTQADKYLNTISTSAFIKELKAIDIQKVMLKNEFPPEKIKQVKQWQEQIKSALGNPLLGKVLGREAAVAFCPDALLVARLGPSFAAAEFLAKMPKSWGADVALTQSMYKGFKIQHVEVKGKKIKVSYLRLNDLLIATGESSKGLERVIDVHLKNIDSLAQNPVFMGIVSRGYADGQGFVYLNLALALDTLKEQLGAWVTAGGVEAYGLSFTSGELSQFKLMASLNLKALTPAQRKILSCPQGDNKSLPFIPANAIGYNWGNCYDFKEYWQDIQEQLHSSSPEFLAWGQGFVTKIQRRLKINIEKEVLPVLGSEMGGYLTDIDTRGMFPFPRFLFFIKINDRAQANELLRRATANPLVDIEEEQYGKVDLRFMRLPFGANMDPAYAFLGDYLLIASSRQLLKKSIDVFAEPGRSLVQEKVFKQFNLSPAGAASITFMKLGDMSLRAIALAEWMDKYLGTQVSLAASYKDEVEQQAGELAKAIDGKEEELGLARVKLKKLQAVLIEQGDEGAIANLQREIEALQEEIGEGKRQIEEMPRQLAAYDAKLRSINQVMFNTQHVLIPVFKSVGTLNAYGARVVFGERYWEAEIHLK